MISLFKKLIPAFFFILSYRASSQEFNKVFYNEKWEMTSMRYARYYRNSGFNKEKLVFDSLVFDHYPNGNIEMTGRYSDGSRNGDFVYYYTDNSIKLISCYKDNRRTGTWTSYYPNGQVRISVDYSQGERVIGYYDEQGNSLLKNLSGKFSSSFFYNYQYRCFSDSSLDGISQKFLAEGNLKSGFRDGTWILKKIITVSSRKDDGTWNEEETPETMYSFRYKAGKLMKGLYYSSEGKVQQTSSDTLIWLINEPAKISITESLLTSPNRYIRQNYIINAIEAKERKLNVNSEVVNEKGIPQFFESNFSIFAGDCSDTLSMEIILKYDNENNVSVSSISPLINKAFEDEVKRIAGLIFKVGTHSSQEYHFTYRVKCLSKAEARR